MAGAARERSFPDSAAACRGGERIYACRKGQAEACPFLYPFLCGEDL